MSAERLRQAAAKVREVAEGADLRAGESEWWTTTDLSTTSAFGPLPKDSRHIALWSPPAAFAVADWLDAEADALDAVAASLCAGDGWTVTVSTGPQALALADLILDGAP